MNHIASTGSHRLLPAKATGCPYRATGGQIPKPTAEEHAEITGGHGHH